MAMTSLRRYATEAAASLPSTMIWGTGLSPYGRVGLIVPRCSPPGKGRWSHGKGPLVPDPISIRSGCAPASPSALPVASGRLAALRALARRPGRRANARFARWSRKSNRSRLRKAAGRDWLAPLVSMARMIRGPYWPKIRRTWRSPARHVERRPESGGTSEASQKAGTRVIVWFSSELVATGSGPGSGGCCRRCRCSGRQWRR